THTHRKMAAATMATASSTVVGLGTTTLSSPKKLNLSSGFLKSPVAARNPLRLAQASGGKFTCFERDWLRRDLNVIGFGLIGWIAPSSIPVINGDSLTGLFFSSIGTELSHFPTGPALTSPFWLWLVLWHLGLFVTLTFGQIGFKGRTEEYFEK
ncbi:photosystem I protein PsaO, partial [Clostridiaceae bacterium]|nr:photosystem I protein PsaO [Clostridiaceae bacterium]